MPRKKSRSDLVVLASTLANDVLMQIAKVVDGNYQSGDYFSLP